VRYRVSSAACRSDLPRERFSPLARKSRVGIVLGESAVRDEAAVRRMQPNGLRMTPKRSFDAQSFDHLVGNGEQRWRDCDASTFAVVRFTTRPNLVGCSIGMSPGFVPRRILPTYSASSNV
jgi:hypothetical protein